MGKDLIPPHIVGPGRESFVTVSRAAPHVQMLYYLCKLQAACCMLLSVGNSNPHKVFQLPAYANRDNLRSQQRMMPHLE